MNNSVTFRLTTDKTEGTWTLRGGSAKKNGVAKFINYWPGSNSIFDEDNKESIVKPQQVIFRYNDTISDPGVEIIVPNENKVLIDYLMAHPFYGVHYKIHNEEEIDEEKSSGYDKVEEALFLIKETEDVKIQAIALAVFGIDALGWSAAKCKATLKEKAITNSQFIIGQIKTDNYESKYLSALAFFSGIVTEDSLKSAIVWDDKEKGIILRLAKGEKGIEKLGELLAVESDESFLILQEIGVRLNKKTPIEDKKVVEATIVTGKTEAELRAEITAELTANTKSEADIRAEVMAELAANATIPESVVLVVKTDATFDATDLVQVQAKFKEVTGNELPQRYKNDLEWLNTKIVEKEI
jgi:hypothetical protein